MAAISLPGVYEYHNGKWTIVTMYEHHNGHWCHVYMLDYKMYTTNIDDIDQNPIQDINGDNLEGIYALRSFGSLIESSDDTPIQDISGDSILGLRLD